MSRLTRQSFLGADSDEILFTRTVGIVGLGGGGSHIVQQLNHLGIGGFVLVDNDNIEESNTNRLIGGTLRDVEAQASKVSIATRQILSLQPSARIVGIENTWQSALGSLKLCDVIIGAVDSFQGRDELERFARQSLIPYIDIGMTVTQVINGFLISGQIVLSTPQSLCLRCYGVINDLNIQREVEKYGAAGSEPQVVWANGVLASTAVGLLIQILTPWFESPPIDVYLEYDGNKNTITNSKKLEILKDTICQHHPVQEVGDLLFNITNYR